MGKAVYRRARASFDFHPPLELRLKGKDQPVSAYPLPGLRAVPAGRVLAHAGRWAQALPYLAQLARFRAVPLLEAAGQTGQAARLKEETTAWAAEHGLRLY